MVVAAGFTLSSNLPTTAGAVQTWAGGSTDAFVARIVTGRPALVSLTPSSGTGTTVTFRAVYRHPAGYAQLNLVQLLMPGGLGQSACWAYYLPQTNSLWLMNDAQTSGLGPIVPGSNASLQNSQCIVNGSTSAASGYGTDLTLSVSLTFKATSMGVRNVFLYAQDAYWQGVGWSPLGSWNTAPSRPAVVSLTPSSGSGAAATFQAIYRHPAGFAQLNMVQLLMPGNAGQGACWVYYLPQLDSFWLMNDAQNAALGPLAAGSNGSVQNSACILNGSGTSASEAGTDLAIVVALTFKAPFTGTHNVFLYAQDTSWQSAGWSPLGSWMVATGQPAVVSISPPSGSGAAVTFTAVYRHSAGFSQLNQVQLLMPGDSGQSACWVYYLPQSNSLYLMNDSQTAAGGPVIPGSNASVQNSQCTLNGVGSSVSGSGTDLTVAMSLTFKPTFAGARNVFYILKTWIGKVLGGARWRSGS